MKNNISNKTNFFGLFFLLFFIVSSSYAQVAINSTGSAPNTNAMLDVDSANRGVLIPRVSYSNISGLSVQGLLVYVTTGGPSGNGFYYYESGWKKISDGSGILPVSAGGTGTGLQFTSGSVVFSGTAGTYLEDNLNFYWDDVNNRLGIGSTAPSTNLFVGENNGDLVPAILVSQSGSGDAALSYYLNSSGITSITTGIDNNDNHNFKISDATSLTGTSYSDQNTMLRIHTEAGSKGISDINHQSRARAWLSISQVAYIYSWSPIEFDVKYFDEHGEFTISPGSSFSGFFTAKEDGYYQVNARTEVNPETGIELIANGYVSIAIFVNGLLSSKGNNLQVISSMGELFPNNNAPNVSDVLYLNSGDFVEIYVWQSFANPYTTIKGNPENTYVSIHKIS